MDKFADILIEWYGRHGRDLPWRHTKDPYRIWVSEIILQQTRVVQGYEYYCRFIKRFPDVGTLAEASEDEVMKYWQGLGYYSRARSLHTAAQEIMERFDGYFPERYEEVRSLKGVGDYTAAAVCSIAYGQPYATVDGNVYRVLSRLFDFDLPIDTSEGRKHFAALANELLDRTGWKVVHVMNEYGPGEGSPKTGWAKDLLDGDPVSYWTYDYKAGIYVPLYIVFDMGKEVTVRGVRITARTKNGALTNPPCDFTIQTAKSITGDGMDESEYTFSERFQNLPSQLYNSVYLSEIQRARYIRFILHDSWNGKKPGGYRGGTFAEFDVWGNLEELDLD